ncbi:multifunctional CCA addition/repair protein [Alteromonas facilis]|uniref:multifunctional CCA addition/repair protein n=1 Tax=Alteromonas facilis TaxID=2048004 RepID=UPI000C28B87F|nr:multifunctional CCA addition/repair protein [Alteromonas facilis]
MSENKLDNVYLVGGAVRDRLLGVPAQDEDFVVVGKTPEFMESIGFQAVGADFPVFIHPKTRQEYALARTERKQGRGYKGFVVDASANVTLEQDLARRDLTINAMAINEAGELVDPFGGKTDVENKVLRHTTQAFIEDPVRVLRIARFYARFGPDWTIHPSTKALIHKMFTDGELTHLVAERVWKETEKALSEPFPQLYFETLAGLYIFPEIDNLKTVQQPLSLEQDVFSHTMTAMQLSAAKNLGSMTCFAVLMHDVGKVNGARDTNEGALYETDGASIIQHFCDRWRVPNKFRELAILTATYHRAVHMINTLSIETIYELLAEKLDAVRQPERFEQFLLACECDAQSGEVSLPDEQYTQADLARKMALILKAFDKSVAAQHAIQAGKKGADIGESVRQQELEHLREFSTN